MAQVGKTTTECWRVGVMEYSNTPVLLVYSDENTNIEPRNL
jgi:hypothetical protein